MSEAFHIIWREYIHIVSSFFFSAWVFVLLVMLRRIRLRLKPKICWYHKLQPMEFETICAVAGCIVTFGAYLREPIDAGFGDWIPKSFLDLFAGWAFGAVIFYILFRRVRYWVIEWVD